MFYEDSTQFETSLNAVDVERLSEYFEGSVDDVYAFARITWLPDAEHSALALAAAVLACDESRTAFLCDHLRSGATCVGADKISFHATCVQLAAHEGRWREAAFICARMRRALREISQCLSVAAA